MNEILVFGHKSPDTDTIISSIVMSNLQNKLGKNTKAVRLGELSKETQYICNKFNIEEIELIESVDEGAHVILVDHNEFTQSANGIEKAVIDMVVDHHRVCGFQTAEPLYYRAEPVGCTATVIYKLYNENKVEIEEKYAALMLSAIISDTLLFKSPTVTKEDIEAANTLAKIANIDINTYGLEMLKAGTDLSDLTADELVRIDSKEFEVASLKIEVAQISTASIEDMMERKADIEVSMNKVIEEKNLSLFLVLITDILNSNSQIIALGKNADLAERSFAVKLENNSAYVPGLVSRKKQVIPVLTKNI
ncbi:MAG: manganese-dependent inorganic pyrophosphatase [Clostridia bacterium]